MISFIIPAYNSEKTIRRCLESILSQEVEKEIIVIDNGSSDRTREIVSSYPVKLLTEQKRGPAATRNAGLKIAKGGYIAFVDSDVTLPVNWAKKALGELEEDEKIAAVGGPAKNTETTLISRLFDPLFLYYVNKERKFVDSLATMSALYREDAIKGEFFNETFILPAGEDLEFNFRIRKKGYKLALVKSLEVLHYHPATFKNVMRRWYNYGKNYIRPYIHHKQVNTVFMLKVLYPFLLLFFILSSFVYPVFLKGIFLMIAGVFLTYTVVGIKFLRNPLLIFLFPFLHTLKFLIHSVGIVIGVIKYVRHLWI